jgi:DNA-binding MarR family transcriptional regulator
MVGDEGQQHPLDALICEQVLIAIRRMIRAIDLHSRMLLQRHGLTGPQLVVLKTLFESGEVAIGELARYVHLSQATVTGVIERLFKRDLVTRRRCDVDKRRILVRTTAKAEELLENAPSLLQDQFVREFGKLHDWEKSLILSSVQRIVAMMEAESLDVMPILAIGPIDEAPAFDGDNRTQSLAPTDDNSISEVH